MFDIVPLSQTMSPTHRTNHFYGPSYLNCAWQEMFKMAFESYPFGRNSVVCGQEEWMQFFPHKNQLGEDNNNNMQLLFI